MREHVAVPRMAVDGGKDRWSGPIGVATIGICVGKGNKHAARIESEQTPHGINSVVVRTGETNVNRDPLLIRVIGMGIGSSHHVVQSAVVSEIPILAESAPCGRTAEEMASPGSAGLGKEEPLLKT